MTLQALRDGFPARAAAIVGTFTDLDQYAKEDPNVEAMAPQIFPDYQTNRAAIIERRSAVRWADRIGAPLLIMHGGDDKSVNPAHSLQLAAALQQSGKTYELVIAAGARHVWTRSRPSVTNARSAGLIGTCAGASIAGTCGGGPMCS